MTNRSSILQFLIYVSHCTGGGGAGWEERAWGWHRMHFVYLLNFQGGSPRNKELI
jgi:hypothetical protein